MKEKIFIIVCVFLLLSSLPIVIGLTASIGNSRMVLRVDVGDTVEKYILVKNVNDVAVTIDFEPHGDLGEKVVLAEESFVLQPGEEKKAEFSIKVDEAGATETKINVGFSSEEGSSVGLSSTIIIFTNDEDGDNFDELSDDQENENVDSEVESEELDNEGAETLDNKIFNSETKRSWIIMLIVFMVLLVCFLILLYFFSSNKGKKRSAKLEKRVTKRNAS
jgi:hypothetical protein